MQRIVKLKEKGYADEDAFDYAPEDNASAIGQLQPRARSRWRHHREHRSTFAFSKIYLKMYVFFYIRHRKRGCYAPKKLEQGGRIHFLIFMHQTVCGSIPYSRRIFGFRSKKFATIIKILLKSKAFKC